MIHGNRIGVENMGKCKTSASKRSSAYYYANRDAIRLRQKKYRDANKEKLREYDRNRYSRDRLQILTERKLLRRKTPNHDKFTKIKCKYGLTRPQYDAIVLKQKNKCAICLRSRKLYVDHCHATGRVRGLLCCRCNMAMGALGDDKNGVKRALKYLSNGKD